MKTTDQRHAEAVWWLGSRLTFAVLAVIAAWSIGCAIGSWLA